MTSFEDWQLEAGPSAHDDGSFMMQFGCVAGLVVIDVADGDVASMKRQAELGEDRLSCKVVRWLLDKYRERYELVGE